MKSFTLLLLFLTTIRLTQAKDLFLKAGGININGHDLGTEASADDLKNVINLKNDFWEKEFNIDENGDSPLHLAAEKNDVEKIKRFLSLTSGDESYLPVLEYKNKLGYTPLKKAVVGGQFDAMKTLVEHRANIQVLDDDKLTLLHWAAFMNHAHLFQYLIKNGVALEQKDALGKTALGLAGLAQNSLAFIRLLHLGANPNVDVSYTNSKSKTLTLLAQAANIDSLYQVELLIKAGVDINKPGSDGLTPLMLATLKNHTAIAHTLLNAGADINYQTRVTLLHALVENHKPHFIDFAVQHGADLELKAKISSRTPLSIASSVKDNECFEKLLVHGANPNGKGVYADMPMLYEVISMGNLRQMELLLSYKADPNAIYNNAFTPLIYVLRINELKQSSYEEIKFTSKLLERLPFIKLLLANGADPNLAPATQAPIHVAAIQGDFEILKKLVEAGADIHAMFEDENPFSIAVARNFKDIASYLTARGAKMPPSFHEKLSIQVDRLLHFLLLVITHPITGALLIAVMILKVIQQIQHSAHLQQVATIQLEQRKIQRLRRRDAQLFNSLKEIVTHFYPHMFCDLRRGEFYISGPRIVADKYQKMSDGLYDVLLKQLTSSCLVIEKNDLVNNEVCFKLADPENFDDTLNEVEIIKQIQNDLTSKLHATPQYQLEQLQLQIPLLQSDLTNLEFLRTEHLSSIKVALDQCVSMQKDIAALILIQDANCLENRKVFNALQALQNSMIYFVASKDHDEQPVYTAVQLEERFDYFVALNVAFNKPILDVTQESVDQLRKQLLAAHHNYAGFRHYLVQFNGVCAHLLEKLNAQYCKLKDVLFDYKVQQKADANMLARESMLQRKEPPKPKTVPPEPKPRTVIVPSGPVALPKQVIAAPKPVAATTTTRKEIDYRQVQTHIINLGDLLQAYEKEESEQDHSDYKYSILLEALRVFELTKQVTFNGVAISIRNALMHNHRYIDLESIVEFAHSIAHMPSGERTHAAKLEDALRSPDQGTRFAIINRLRSSNLYQSHVVEEREKPSARVYLETLSYLLDDLSHIQIKDGSQLDSYPNKVRAIKGILYCIGECQQQLFLLDPDSFMMQRFIRCKKNSDNGFAELMKTALRIREAVGHHDVNEVNNNEDFIILAHQFNLHRRHAAAIKSEFDEQVLLSASQSVASPQVPRPQ